MANVIKHKRGSGSDPVASDLVVGEVAIRTDVGKLFTKMDNGSVAEIAGGGSDIAINTLSSSSGTGGGSATFNGSAYRFTLSAPPSVSAQQLLVSINGVIQKPVAGTGQPSEGFSVDGTDIILGDAPATGSDFFILTFKSLGVSEPADNSVTSAKIADGAIVNADINASAAIAGTKISPDFGSQGITTTGVISMGNGLTLTGTNPFIDIIDSNNNSDFTVKNDNGTFEIEDKTNSNAVRLAINSSGNVGIGTTTIGNKLQVHEASSNASFAGFSNDTTGSSSSDGLIVGVDSDENGVLYHYENKAIRFATNNAERMRIDSSGLVNIGSGANASGLSPLLHLHKAASNATAYFHITNADTGITNTNGLLIGYNASLDALIFNKQDTPLRFATNGAERMRISNAGNVGIGTTSPEETLDLGNATQMNLKIGGRGYIGQAFSTAATILGHSVKAKTTGTTSGGMIVTETNSGGGAPSAIRMQSGNIEFHTAASGTQDADFNSNERLRIDSSGRVLVGNTDASVVHTNADDVVIGNTTASVAGLSIATSTSGYATLQFSDGAGSKNQGQIAYNHADNSLALTTNSSVRMHIDSSGNVGIKTTSPIGTLDVHDGTFVLSKPSSNSSSRNWRFVPDNAAAGSLGLQVSTAAGGSTFSNVIEISSSGEITHNSTKTQGQTFVTLTGGGTSNFSVMVFGVNSGGHNTGSCAVALGKHSTNNRSLNAAGTVNASGNDYAEYMTKSSDFTLAKGDICGIDANGKLTNKFSESISFVVKSTDPSFVGGDAWGNEDILGEKPADDSDDLPAYEAKMEAARKMVDRIAFSGQVPVNVTGATAGQHIIPTEGSGDTITGVAKTEASLSMAEYMSSIGKVIALESDGRAKIIVKVS